MLPPSHTSTVWNQIYCIIKVMHWFSSFQRTSELCALENKVSVTRDQLSTGWSLSSCARYDLRSLVWVTCCPACCCSATSARSCVLSGWRLHQPQWNGRKIHLWLEVSRWELQTEAHRSRLSLITTTRWYLSMAALKLMCKTAFSRVGLGLISSILVFWIKNLSWFFGLKIPTVNATN